MARARVSVRKTLDSDISSTLALSLTMDLANDTTTDEMTLEELGIEDLFDGSDHTLALVRVIPAAALTRAARFRELTVVLTHVVAVRARALMTAHRLEPS